MKNISEHEKTITTTTSTPKIPSYQTIDYFPLTLGTEWRYNIDYIHFPPLSYSEIFWPKNTPTESEVRGEVYFPKRSGNHMTIKIVNTTSSHQAEIKVLEDDLIMFDYVTKITWTGIEGNKTGFVQTVYYSPHRNSRCIGPYARCVWEEGFSKNIIFFEGKTKDSLTLNYGKDSITFLGYDNNVPDYADIPCMHFQRHVMSEPVIESILDIEFTEDTWFAPKKGMIRLEQKNEGETTLVWTLERYEPG
jgi:hypothetical protein